MTGRTVEQLRGWVELLELCDDDCEIFGTTKAMRESVLVADQELHRLHKIESLFIRFAAFHKRIETTDDDRKWDYMDELWDNVGALLESVEELVPGALSSTNIEALIRRPVETLVPRSLLDRIA